MSTQVSHNNKVSSVSRFLVVVVCHVMRPELLSDATNKSCLLLLFVVLVPNGEGRKLWAGHRLSR